MFGTKSKSWEYENEIRLIYSTSKRKGYNPFALKSIYFGLNMDEKHQIQIMIFTPLESGHVSVIEKDIIYNNKTMKLKF